MTPVRFIIAYVVSVLCATPVAIAQTFPDRPIKIIVPSAPAGGTDILARLLAAKLQEKLNASFVVENRSVSLVATDNVAKAPADGYTLLMGGLFNMVMNSALITNLPYDPNKDFTVVGYVSAYPFVALTNPGAGPSTLKDFVAYAKSKPGDLNLGTAGLGTLHQVWGAILTRSLGLDLVQVNFRGAAAAQQELMAGRIHFLFDNVSAARGFIEAGSFKALAVSSTQRTKLLPDVPTINETGLVEFNGESWFAVFAPAKTPEPVLAYLRKGLAQVKAERSFIDIVERDGGRLLDTPPEKQAEFLKSEIDRWVGLVQKYRVKAE